VLEDYVLEASTAAGGVGLRQKENEEGSYSSWWRAITQEG